MATTKGRTAPPVPEPVTTEPTITIAIDPAAVTLTHYAYIARAARGEITDEETLDILGGLITSHDAVDDLPLTVLGDVLAQVALAVRATLAPRVHAVLRFGDLRVLAAARRGEVQSDAAVALLKRLDMNPADASQGDVLNTLRLVDALSRERPDQKNS